MIDEGAGEAHYVLFHGIYEEEEREEVEKQWAIDVVERNRINSEVTVQALGCRSSVIEMWVPGDGNCFYTVLSVMASAENRNSQQKWRDAIANELQTFAAHYMSFLSGDDSLPHIITGVKQEDWADNISVQAASNITGRSLVIWHKGSPQAPIVILPRDL